MTTSVSANRKITITASRAFTFFLHKSVVLKNKMEFANPLPNFDINIFDDEQDERIYGGFVPMTNSEVDNLIETEEMPTQRERHCTT